MEEEKRDKHGVGNFALWFFARIARFLQKERIDLLPFLKELIALFALLVKSYSLSSPFL